MVLREFRYWLHSLFGRGSPRRFPPGLILLVALLADVADIADVFLYEYAYVKTHVYERATFDSMGRPWS